MNFTLKVLFHKLLVMDGYIDNSDPKQLGQEDPSELVSIHDWFKHGFGNTRK